MSASNASKSSCIHSNFTSAAMCLILKPPFSRTLMILSTVSFRDVLVNDVMDYDVLNLITLDIKCRKEFLFMCVMSAKKSRFPVAFDEGLRHAHDDWS